MKIHKIIVKTLIMLLSTKLLSCTQYRKEVSYFDTRSEINYESLKEGFYNVPQEAKMRTWWFWMSGIATKKSITQDLEAMKTNGIAGAILIDNGGEEGIQFCKQRIFIQHLKETSQGVNVFKLDLAAE
jgi:hypothetical protein